MSYYLQNSQLQPTHHQYYPDPIYQTTMPLSTSYIPGKQIGSNYIPAVYTKSYNMPVSIRQEQPVLETPPRVKNLSYSQVIPQTVQTSYQPLYQINYEKEPFNNHLVREQTPNSLGSSQIYQSQQIPSDSVYLGSHTKTYNPIKQEELERVSEQDYIFQQERQREIDYNNWKQRSNLRSRSPISNQPVAPIRPSIPLASSYVLQPGQYSDIKQNISNYENSLLESLNTQEKFKQLKDDMNKSSYTYSQMISTVLYNFKEILLALKEIEKCKNDLINREDFNISLFYHALNIKGSTKPLSSDQLRLALIDLNFGSIDIYDIELLFSKYSNERSADYLTLNDFKKLFIPYYINSRRKYEFDSRDDQQEISIETQRISARVIKMLLSLENSQEYYRQLMQKRLIDLAYCFDYIDRERKGVLNLTQMQTFLQGNDIYFNVEDINLLIQRFNNAFPIGPQLDHVIKLNEFIYELSPKSRIPYLKE